MTEAKKSLGQHWLDDEVILAEIVRFGGVEPGDNVLEIGPGHGSLTKKLLDTGAKVVAVEKDEALIAKFSYQEFAKNLQIVRGDILEYDLGSLPLNYKVVANIPYYLTSNLIRILSESKNPPYSITVLVQKEVAERLGASPGQMSILGISAQFYYDCSLGAIVTADKFRPPPRVNSQVVHMVRKSSENYSQAEIKQFFRLVKAGFSSRRKTLLNSLSGGLDLPKDQILNILDSCDIKPSVRPQELSLEKWKKLLASINT